MGAPLARYVPALQELAYVEPKEEPLTQAQLERMEREALRKEQEEEFEQALMEDRVKEAERQAKQDKIDAALRAEEEASNAKSTAMASYTGRIEAAKGRLAAEPAEGVMLRLRCPDGHQLTRKFAADDMVQTLYDYIDVERYNKASKVSTHTHNAHTRTQEHTHMRARAHAHALARMHANKRARTHTHIHTYTHTHIHTYTHAD